MELLSGDIAQEIETAVNGGNTGEAKGAAGGSKSTKTRVPSARPKKAKAASIKSVKTAFLLPRSPYERDLALSN